MEYVKGDGVMCFTSIWIGVGGIYNYERWSYVLLREFGIGDGEYYCTKAMEL